MTRSNITMLVKQSSNFSRKHRTLVSSAQNANGVCRNGTLNTLPCLTVLTAEGRRKSSRWLYALRHWKTSPVFNVVSLVVLCRTSCHVHVYGELM